jgi:hypothetical protein
MNTNIYALFDKKSEEYGMPVYSHNDKTAQHAILSTMLKHPGDDLAQFPADYILYRIGQYNTETGEILSIHPLHVMECITVYDTYRKRTQELHVPQPKYDPPKIDTPLHDGKIDLSKIDPKDYQDTVDSLNTKILNAAKNDV